MSVLEILTAPDPRLKHKCSVVDSFDKNLSKIVEDMYDTLYKSENGIGLAAPQVGITKRIIVMDLKEDGKSLPRTFVNPRILKFSSKKFVNEEGCLSIPNYFAEIERSTEVEVEWFDIQGNKMKEKFSGLMSICMQHEVDHLNGILFIDYLSSIKRKMALQKSKKSKKKTKTDEKL